MDDFAEVFSFSSWPELACAGSMATKASWNSNEYAHNLPITCTEPENTCNLSGTQNLTIGSTFTAHSENRGQSTQLVFGLLPEDNSSNLPLSDDTLASPQLNKHVPEFYSRNPSIASQQHADHISEEVPRGPQEVAACEEVLQRMERGTTRKKVLKFDKSLSFSGNTNNGISNWCQQLYTGTSQTSGSIRHSCSSGSLPLSLDFARSRSYPQEAMPVEFYHPSKKLWSDEVCWQRLQECSYNAVDRRHGKQIRPYSAQSQSRASGNVLTTRPRMRARRGQATDPHSIAERLRRERIADRIKKLQELVPNTNKADKISMLDDIIEYVKFLKLQKKVFNTRKQQTNTSSSILSEVSLEDKDSLDGTLMAKVNGAFTDNNIIMAEEEVAKLMEVDIGSAMRFLQSKRLCLMPVSLAATISGITDKSKCSNASKQT